VIKPIVSHEPSRDFGPFYVKSQAMKVVKNAWRQEGHQQLANLPAEFKTMHLSGVSTGVICGVVTPEDLTKKVRTPCKASKIIIVPTTSELNSLTGDPLLKRRGWGNYSQAEHVLPLKYKFLKSPIKQKV